MTDMQLLRTAIAHLRTVPDAGPVVEYLLRLADSPRPVADPSETLALITEHRLRVTPAVRMTSLLWIADVPLGAYSAEGPTIADAVRACVARIKGLLIFLALSLGLAGSAHAGERTKSYATWCSAKAADLATTEWALSNGQHETNPLMQSRAVRYGAGAGTCLLAGEVDYRLRKHPKGRWAVRILGIGLLAYAVQNNARAAR